MTTVAILGAGQIGRAIFQILTDLKTNPSSEIFKSDLAAFVIDSTKNNIDKLSSGDHYQLDLSSCSVEKLSEFLTQRKVTHVINALPFFLNDKVASASVRSGCNYIDFTEDDLMADKVQSIFNGSGLTCAVKCGLAPGFINYIGYDLVGLIDNPRTLTISVGALPRTVSYDLSHPENSYNLTWSVDGLVNEYIRPCRVRKGGEEKEIPALSGLTKVILDGTEYEASYTSGGIGSLVKDLINVPDVQYMTLRYPGHYKYVNDIINANFSHFERVKKVFLEKFAFTDDDVIVVYANAIGKDADGTLIRRSYSNKFYGINGLTGIQSTTAGSGVAMLELILQSKVRGIIDHKDVSLSEFIDTAAFRKYYNTKSS